MKHSPSSVQPTQHPSWCDPRICQHDSMDPGNPVHGSQPVTVVTQDGEFDLSVHTTTQDVWLRVTVTSTGLALMCECGRPVESVASVDITPEDLTEVMSTALTQLLLVGRPVPVGDAA